MNYCRCGHFSQSRLLLCKNCQQSACELCWSGGKSGKIGKTFRFIIAIYTIGISEMIRWFYRKTTRKCPNCQSSNFMRL